MTNLFGEIHFVRQTATSQSLVPFARKRQHDKKETCLHTRVSLLHRDNILFLLKLLLTAECVF